MNSYFVSDPKKFRRCPECGELKHLSEYAKNPTKSKNRDYVCKECKAGAARARRPKRQEEIQIASVKEDRYHMMTDEAFAIFYGNEELREHIHRCARRRAKTDRERQKDYMQAAWAKIALCEPGKEIDFYKRKGETAIESEYNRDWQRKEYGLSYIETMSMDEFVLWQRGVWE